MSPVFRDRDDLSSAGQLGPQIQAALTDSEALVVVCSPNAAQSTYVDAEILAFKRLGRGERIYAFIVDGEPNSGDANECFPPALRYELDTNGNLGAAPANPIAADARPGKDGKSLALLKLQAGLFGLPLDTLRQREARRRHLRMTAITLLAVGVMLVTSVLAVQAVIARKAAERRQKQAETLVDFMLGDLNDKLSEVGRMDILSSVNDKAMAYFQSLPKTDVTDEALEQRAKALVKIGNVRSEQGDFTKAMDSYRASAALSEQLAVSAPFDVKKQLAYADVLTYIGLTDWYQGNLDSAKAGFEAAHRVLAAARKYAPDEPELLYQLSTLDNNLGHIFETDGKFEEATKNYRRMLVASQRLAKLGPDNDEWQNQLALAHNNLAKMALLRGDLKGAIAGYREDLAIKMLLVDRNPHNNDARRNLVIGRATLGRTLGLAGQAKEGIPLVRMAVDEARALRAMEPGSTLFQSNLGLYALQLASLEGQEGNTEEASQLAKESLGIFDTLIKTSPDQAAWQRNRAEALTERARQTIDAGASMPSTAAAMLQSGLAILDPQLDKSPQDRSVVLAIVDARLRLASISPPPLRNKLAAQSLATLDTQMSARGDPRLLALRVDALQQLGRVAEAEAIAESLAATGYRATITH